MMLCKNTISNLNQWKTVFNQNDQAHRDAGLIQKHVWKDIENPNHVFFLFDVEDTEKAKAFINNPDAATSAQAAGVIDGEYYFIESVE